MIISTVPRFVVLDKNDRKVIYILNRDKIIRTDSKVKIMMPRYDMRKTGYRVPYMLVNGIKKKVDVFDISKTYRNFSFNMLNTIIAYGRKWKREEDDLNIMSLDIEVGTSGGEPVPSVNKILTIGFAINDGKPEILYSNKNTDNSDIPIIKKFIDIILERNVDVITGYYSSVFDIPYIIRRAYSLGLLNYIVKLAKGIDELRDTIVNSVYYGNNITYSIGAILHHDIFNEVKRDQALGKLKHKTMKEVGKYLLKDYIESGKMNIREMERDELSNMLSVWNSNTGRAKIIEYQASDVELQKRLSIEIYTSRIVEIANTLNVPLNVVFDMRPSTLLQIDLLRRLEKNNMIITSNNKSEFTKLYIRAKKLGNKKPYQGAWTEALRTGIYNDIYKYDYSSLYPSIIDTFNLSYETTEIVNIKNLDNVTKDDIDVDRMNSRIDNDKIYIEIYDSNQNSYITISIDMNRRGIIPNMISEYRIMRREAKTMMKKYDKGSTEYMKYDSKQQAIKILNNSIYGVVGNANMAGWLPAGLLTTAIGRFLAKEMVKEIERQGKIPIEIDTDGVLVSGRANVDDLNNRIRSTIKTKFGIDEEKISVTIEEEKFNKVFMYKAKNYILQEKEGEYPIIHGSALKSSRHPKVIDRMVEIIVDYAIFGKISKDEAIYKIFDIEELSIDYFIMTSSFTKDITRYKTETEIIKEAKRLIKMGELVGEGYTMEYVMTKNEITGKAEPISVVRLMDDKDGKVIHYDYYKNMMTNILREMGIISDYNSNNAGDIIDIFT